MAVSLRAVSRENVRAVCELRLASGQEHLVAAAAFTVAEVHYEPGALLRAIYLDETPVGVLGVEVETGTPYLVRFMVDASFQAAGSGGKRSGCWPTSFVPPGSACSRRASSRSRAGPRASGGGAGSRTPAGPCTGSRCSRSSCSEESGVVPQRHGIA